MKIHYLLLLTLLAGCRKNNDKDTQPPQVTITSPTSNSAWTFGDVIPIKANISDNNKIAELHMHVTNKTSGALLWDLHFNPGIGSYLLDQFIVGNSNTDYKVIIIAKDQDANETTASVEFKSY